MLPRFTISTAVEKLTTSVHDLRNHYYTPHSLLHAHIGVRGITEELVSCGR